MFGIYRYILSFFVVIFHISPNFQCCSGIYAVFSFYMLSGYLMTYIVVNIYGFSLKGLKTFFLNRALRIYPSYICTVIFSIFAIIITSGYTSEFHSAIKLPSSFNMWFQNIFIFGLKDSQIRLVPPAWSLNVELIFYIFIALIFSRKKSFSCIWFTISAIYTGFLIYNHYDFSTRYYPIYAASLPFSTGSLIFYYKEKLNFLSKNGLLLVSSLYITNSIFSNYIWEDATFEGLYVSYILSAFILIYLLNIKTKQIPTKLKNFDKLLGNMSYPIFLVHWPIASIVSEFIFNYNKPNFIFVATCLLAANIYSLIIINLIEKPIDVYRNKIRPIKL